MLSRVIYIAVYVAGVAMVRSVVFMAGFIGLVIMALALF
ncbi:MAPEG family protein [Roseovarius tolerans]